MASSTRSTSNQFSRSEQSFLTAEPRLDGRLRNDFRRVQLINGCVAQSAGSCRWTNGICSVKAAIVQPSVRQPARGVLTIHVDGSHSMPRSQYDALQTKLQQLISLPTDEEATNLLVIQKGAYVWQLHVDVWLLSADTVDTISLTIRSAVQNTVLPRVHAEDLSMDTTATQPLSLSTLILPIVVTVTCFSSSFMVVDATELEASHGCAQIHVALNETQQVCGMKWSSTTTLSTQTVAECIQLAVQSYAKRQESIVVSTTDALSLVSAIVLQ